MKRNMRNKNNASSVNQSASILKTQFQGDEYSDDGNLLIDKHIQIRDSMLSQNVDFKNDKNNLDSIDPKIGNQQINGLTSDMVNLKPPIWGHFSPNQDILKLMLFHNFPQRFPVRLDNDKPAQVVTSEISDNKEEMTPIQSTDNKMTKSYIKFWNKFISKQDVKTTSIIDHQLTEMEAGFYPCHLNSLFNSPDTYLKKHYCHKGKYVGFGQQLLPPGNSFTKIASRNEAKHEVSQILRHYLNQHNQYFLIPIELTSKISRSMLKSVEIGQKTQGCNKIIFECHYPTNGDVLKHPLFTIHYKQSIEEENLPPANFCLIDNYPINVNPAFKNIQLQNALFNYPYINHIFHRTDFWIDDLFARFWHYSRYFSDKIDLGNRISDVNAIITKDVIFKYLLSCAVRICVAIKYWVLNEEGATYFRCWCGQRIYESKPEQKLINRNGVGSTKLINLQYKIRTTDIFHQKHTNKRSQHMCCCGKQFKDHTQWFNHVFSLKINDLDRICPISFYNFCRTSIENNSFVCECEKTFNDYDFWSFWLHICNCKNVKLAAKNCCAMCNRTQRSISQGRRSSMSNRKRTKTLKRKSIKKFKSSSSSSRANCGDDNENSGDADVEKNSVSSSKEPNGGDNWKNGDNNIDLPLKMSNQNNCNNQRRK